MRLALVTAYPPSKVTLNEYAYHLAKYFRQHPQVTELILLCEVTSSPIEVQFEESGCKITVQPCWKFNSLTNFFSVMKAVGQTCPDVLLFNLQFMKFGDKKIAAALGLLLPLACKLKGIPTMVLLHNILEQVDLGSAGFTKNKIIQWAYQGIGAMLTRCILAADCVAVTIGQYATRLREKYKANNVVVIPHGTFEIPDEPCYEIDEDDLKVMAFGKFGTYKKVEIFIAAVQQVRARTGKNIEIVIAGTDNPNASGYLEGVRQKYARVPQLRFIGYVAEEEVPVIFRESAMVVFPYTATTGSSGVLHQAGSYGKAVVMPDLGDLGILVKEEGYRAEFFDPQSAESLANAIEKIVLDPAYRTALGKANYAAATALPMSTITERYVAIFNTIMNSRTNSSIQPAKMPL